MLGYSEAIIRVMELNKICHSHNVLFLFLLLFFSPTHVGLLYPRSHTTALPLHLQILAENNQLRKEADDVGPRAELEHWKKRLSKFNHLLDQLKSPDAKAVLAVLAAAKSKLLKVCSHFATICSV